MITELVNQSKDFVKTKNLAECQQFIKTYVNKVIVHGETVEVLFNINIPNEDTDAFTPLTSTENISVLQNEYKEM